MKDTDLPAKILRVWAQSAAAGYITYPVPLESQIGVTDGAASFETGFPPLNFVALPAGGAGPFGKDYNGLGKQLTADLQWLQAGGPISYDAAFSTAIGGYPKGCLIKSTSGVGGYWISTVDDNTSNPDIGGANWLPVSFTGPVAGVLFAHASPGVYSYTVLDGYYSLFGLVVGGGGAGGSVNSATGGGGGAGGLAFGRFPVTPGQVLTVTVGAGGVAVLSSNGGNGGSSSIGSLLSATGGAGGGSAGQGGVGGVGTVSGNGWADHGGPGFNGLIASIAYAGAGGASWFGGGGGPTAGSGGNWFGPAGCGGGGSYGTPGVSIGLAGQNGGVYITG